jgi:hypothetical protein
MERWRREPGKTEPAIKKQKKAIVKGATDFSGMGLIAGLILGGTIGFLPFNSDANFRHALESGDGNNIEPAAKRWPNDSDRFNYATQIFAQNKLSDKAVEMARESVKLNPRNFDGWNNLYNSPLVSENEKREILDRLKALDPNNPDLKKLG